MNKKLMVPDNKAVKNHMYEHHTVKISIGRIMNQLWSDIGRKMRNFGLILRHLGKFWIDLS